MDMFYDTQKDEYYCLRCQFIGNEEEVIEHNNLAKKRYGRISDRITYFE